MPCLMYLEEHISPSIVLCRLVFYRCVIYFYFDIHNPMKYLGFVLVLRKNLDSEGPKKGRGLEVRIR